MAAVLSLVAVVLVANADKFLFSDGGQVSVEATLTGRYDLWTYYWQQFLSAPIFGHGVFLLDRAKNYYGYATSEIGLLKVAAEYGALAALVKFSVVMTATVAAISAVLRADTRPYQLVLALYLLPAVPNFILQSQTRFGGVGDYFFWYSVFYYCFRAIPQLRRHLKI
jgi:O-antigen ligase